MIIGSVHIFAGSSIPAGFLPCDGSAVSRDTYSTLFSVIGTNFGPGDGVTTFNLPSLDGRVVVGSGNSYSVAQSGGEETHSLTASEIPSHQHGVQSHSHGNTFSVTTSTLSHTVGQPAYSYTKPNGTTTSSGSSGTTAFTSTSSLTATRSANITIPDHPITNCNVTCTVGDCAAFDTEPAGNGDGHSNMQPFLSMNYVIYAGD